MRFPLRPTRVSLKNPANCFRLLILVSTALSIMSVVVMFHQQDAWGDSPSIAQHHPWDPKYSSNFPDRAASRLFHQSRVHRSFLPFANNQVCVKKDSNSGTCAWRKCDNHTATTTSEQEFASQGFWIQRSQGGDRYGKRQNVPGICLFSYKYCLISDDHRFIFLHVLKSGGSTVKLFLAEAFCGKDSTSHCDNLKHGMRQVSCCSLDMSHPKYKDYLVFATVRHPLARVFSMYSFAMLTSHGVPNCTTFDEFVMNPSVRSKCSEISPLHYLPQNRFLTDTANCPVTDIVVRLESFSSDMDQVIQAINNSQLSEYYKTTEMRRRMGVGHRQDTSLAEAYKDPKVLAEAIRQNRVDFEQFGYEISIPQ